MEEAEHTRCVCHVEQNNRYLTHMDTETHRGCLEFVK
jgi:hypothetical protein